MDQSIVDLQTEVAETTGVIASAVALINGIAGRIQAAVDAALANGATPEVVGILTTLKSDLDTSSTALADAVAANS